MRAADEGCRDEEQKVNPKQGIPCGSTAEEIHCNPLVCACVCVRWTIVIHLSDFIKGIYCDTWFGQKNTNTQYIQQ